MFSWHGKLKFQDTKRKSVDASGRYFLRGAQPRGVEHAKPKTPTAPSANPVKKEPEEKTRKKWKVTKWTLVKMQVQVHIIC